MLVAISNFITLKTLKNVIVFVFFSITMATLNIAKTSTSAHTDWWSEPSAISSIREFAHLAGLLERSYSSSSGDQSVVHFNVTLTPTKFPQDQLELVMSIQPDLNLLLDSVSGDLEFLEESLLGLVGT